MPMRFRNLFLVIVCAALAFGGSFTCNGSNDDDDDDDDRQAAAAAAGGNTTLTRPVD